MTKESAIHPAGAPRAVGVHGKRVKGRCVPVLALLLMLIGMTSPGLAASPPVADSPDKTIVATPALIREIQFMLLTVGIDPGPVDGKAQQLTKRAAHLDENRP